MNAALYDLPCFDPTENGYKEDRGYYSGSFANMWTEIKRTRLNSEDSITGYSGEQDLKMGFGSETTVKSWLSGPTFDDVKEVSPFLNAKLATHATEPFNPFSRVLSDLGSEESTKSQISLKSNNPFKIDFCIESDFPSIQSAVASAKPVIQCAEKEVSVASQQRLRGKIKKISAFWKKATQHIPNVFRLTRMMNTKPASFLEQQDLSHKEVLLSLTQKGVRETDSSQIDIFCSGSDLE